MTTIFTWPLMFQTRYCPFWKPVTLRVSSTCAGAGIEHLNLLGSAALIVIPIQCVQRHLMRVPILQVHIQVKEGALYHTDAMRPDPPGVCSARTSVVLAAHV